MIFFIFNGKNLIIIYKEESELSDIREKIKRQIEIISSVISEPGKNKIVDLELKYDCNSATIKRDLKDIRKRGIDIHAIKGRGIYIINKITIEKIKELLSEYMLVNNIDISHDNATHFLADAQKEKSIVMLTLLWKSIKSNLVVEIEYKKNYKSNPASKIVEPLLIYQRENNWRMLGRNNGEIKQFLLSKIHAVMLTDKIFEAPKIDLYQDLLSNSFGTWIDEKCYKVKLEFSSYWNVGGTVPLLMKNQKVTQKANGSYVIELEINSLEELARWIAGRGNEVMVLEPVELRNIILELADQIKELYN